MLTHRLTIATAGTDATTGTDAYTGTGATTGIGSTTGAGDRGAAACDTGYLPVTATAVLLLSDMLNEGRPGNTRCTHDQYVYSQ